MSEKQCRALSTTIPDVYKKIYGATDMYVDGNFVVIKTNDLPDHKSPYYSSSMYEAYNGTNTSFNKKPIPFLRSH